MPGSTVGAYPAVTCPTSPARPSGKRILVRTEFRFAIVMRRSKNAARARSVTTTVTVRRLLESPRPLERTVQDDARMRVASLSACLLAAAALVAGSGAAGKSRSPSGSFVTRSGPRLLLSGRPYRFGGANIEWLGLAGYGPSDPVGP